MITSFNHANRVKLWWIVCCDSDPMAFFVNLVRIVKFSDRRFFNVPICTSFKCSLKNLATGNVSHRSQSSHCGYCINTRRMLFGLVVHYESEPTEWHLNKVNAREELQSYFNLLSSVLTQPVIGEHGYETSVETSRETYIFKKRGFFFFHIYYGFTLKNEPIRLASLENDIIARCFPPRHFEIGDIFFFSICTTTFSLSQCKLLTFTSFITLVFVTDWLTLNDAMMSPYFEPQLIATFMVSTHFFMLFLF